MQHQSNLQNATDEKMNTFLEEMRQQFLQTQNVNVIPQSLMYRQTQLMESQVQLLEKNQGQIGEVINNIMNQNSTGHENGASLKQNIFNENRRMMLEMMVPLNQQLNDMKLLYENTKTCSKEVETKIEGLKKILTMQSHSLNAGQPMPGNSSMGGASFQASGANSAGMFSNAGELDPTILQKGISTIKEQMKDVQREALMIETEMEKRFSDMITKNTTRRYLPSSLTDEILAHKQSLKERDVKKAIGENPDKKAVQPDQPSANDSNVPPPKFGHALIREAIMDRLGGTFDYTQYQADLKDITADIGDIQRQFHIDAETGSAPSKFESSKVPPFKFELPVQDGGLPNQSIFTVDPIFGNKNNKAKNKGRTPGVTFEKPDDYRNIKTQPKHLLSCDPRELELASQ